MDTRLSPEHQLLIAKSREFCEKILQPHELEVEENRGLPEASRPALRKAVCDWGFAGVNHSVEDGGEGYSIFEQMLINEQLGRATCGLWAVMWQPAISLRFGTEEQKDAYLRPSCRGQRRGCFAITEPDAGSDPRRVRTKAIADGDLSTRLITSSDNEIGLLAASFNSRAEGLQDLVRQVRDGIGDVSEVSRELRESSGGIAAEELRQAQAIDETNESVDQVINIDSMKIFPAWTNKEE